MKFSCKCIKYKSAREKAPQTVIMDGKIVYESLTKIEKTASWLQTELDKLDVTLENVFLGRVNSYWELTMDIYDDKMELAEPQERP